MRTGRKNFQYVQLLKRKNIEDAKVWCENQFGQRWGIVDNREGTWMCLWAGKERRDHYRFHFENERDYLWFRLRWL